MLRPVLARHALRRSSQPPLAAGEVVTATCAPGPRAASSAIAPAAAIPLKTGRQPRQGALVAGNPLPTIEALLILRSAGEEHLANPISGREELVEGLGPGQASVSPPEEDLCHPGKMLPWLRGESGPQLRREQRANGGVVPAFQHIAAGECLVLTEIDVRPSQSLPDSCEEALRAQHELRE